MNKIINNFGNRQIILLLFIILPELLQMQQYGFCLYIYIYITIYTYIKCLEHVK